jgi:hypothetical protein
MIAFVHIEKCGGTTLIHLLRQAFGLDHCDVIPHDRQSMLFHPSDLQRLLRLRPTTSSIAGHSVRMEAGLHNAYPVRYFTLLRDPVKRYLSDYQHIGKQFLLGKDPSFERWLDLEFRHNYQTRAIAGEPSLDTAHSAIAENFACIGLVEQFLLFVDQLRDCAFQSTGRVLPSAPPGKKNVRSDNASVRDERARLLDCYGDRIVAANRLDIELVNAIAARMEAPSATRMPLIEAEPVRPLRESIKSLRSWLYRNAIYKRSVDWPAFAPHALPLYRPAEANHHQRAA